MDRPILFFSTNDRRRERPGLDFADALMQGLAPDKGLYMMDREALPQVARADLEAFAALPYSEVAYRVMRPFVRGRVPDDVFRALCADAYNYDVPVERYAAGRYVLRLDRGPTASFKDFAARMMARLMQFFLRQQGRGATILTATSGDTGGAVAAAFHGLDNVRVVVLFPGAEVSERQRRQMTTLGGNVFAVDIDGKFDDCQALVKQAFVDADLARLELTSANSINVGRLIPQSAYYFYAASRVLASEGRIPNPPTSSLPNRGGQECPPSVPAKASGGRATDGGFSNPPLCVCVPSGNFGNLMGGLLAKHMGLPVARFVAAVNENDEFPVYLRTEDYEPVVPSRNCLSNAMNVGHPSNLARLVALYGGQMDEKGVVHREPDIDAIRRDILSVEISDAETRAAIGEAWRRYSIVIEPHGAVGFSAIEKLGVTAEYTTLVLETADPAKFPEVVTEIIGVDPPMPESMRRQQSLPEEKHNCGNEYAAFKQLLVELVR